MHLLNIKKIKLINERNYLKLDAFTITGICLLIFCGIRATMYLEKHMDILFWDESLYLTRGLSMFKYIPRDWGPSYSLWYKFLSYIFSDRVELYYFNFKLTTILVSVSLFLLLLSCGIQRILAFLFSLLFLSSYINIATWPRVSHFCIIVICAGIILAKRQHTNLAKFVFLSVAFLICSFARPELFLPFLLCFFITAFLFFYKIKSRTKYEYVLMMSLIVFLVFLYIFFKTPFNNGDTNRGIGVFLQHFAMNYSQWKHDGSIFWLDFPTILKQNFGNAQSLGEMYKANPALIQQHIVSNATNYFTQIGKIILSFFAPLFTKSINWLAIMMAFMLFVVYFSYTKNISNKRQRIFLLLKDNTLTIFVLLLFAMPSVFVCFYAYPREHYILLQTPLLLLIIAIIFSSIAVAIFKTTQKIVVIAVVWFFVMPTAADFSYFRMFRAADNLSNKQTVSYIKKHFTGKDSIHVFDLEGGLTNLLAPNFTNSNYLYLQDREKIKLSTFLQQHQYDIIYKTPILTQLEATKSDTSLFDMLQHPEKYGYFEQKTGNFANSLLIKH